MWIPSHRGLMGNEMADVLAKKGAKEKPESNIDIPIQDSKEEFQEEEWNMTQDILEEEGRYKGKHYFINYYKRSRKKRWFHKIRADRYFCTFINKIRANYYNLNVSLARKDFIQSGQCLCGYELEDIDHVIWDCPNHEIARTKMTEEMNKRKIKNNKEAIDKIIKKEEWNKLQVIYEFILNIGRII